MADPERRPWVWPMVVMMILIMGLGGVAIMAYMWWTREPRQRPLPPPPSDRMPMAPAPDNTITTAPPPPPEGIPSPPKPENADDAERRQPESDPVDPVIVVPKDTPR